MKIIHLGVYHKFFEAEHYTQSYLRAMKTLVYETVVESQFIAAMYLLGHPDIPIVQEGYSEDVRRSDYDAMPAEHDHEFNNAFPKGFPSHIDELTPEQKELLYEHGAVDTLFFLNKIPTIYKSIHVEVADLYIEKVHKKLKKGKGYLEIDYINIKREKEVIECCKEAAKENFLGGEENARIIISYGVLHDFEPICNEYGIKHEFVSTVNDAALKMEIPTFEQYSSSLINSVESPSKENASPEKKESLSQSSGNDFFYTDTQEQKGSSQEDIQGGTKNNPF